MLAQETLADDDSQKAWARYCQKLQHGFSRKFAAPVASVYQRYSIYQLMITICLDIFNFEVLTSISNRPYICAFLFSPAVA
eukprot:g56691.t1